MQTERSSGSGSGGPGNETKRQLAVLVRLASLDKDRDANQRMIDRIPEMIKAREADYTAAQAAEQKAHDDQVLARKAVDEAELDLNSRGEQVTRLEVQLNTAKSNVEYQGLQSQIEKLREASSKQEDEILAFFDRIEALDKAIEAAAAVTAAKKKEFDEFVAVCKTDEVEARAELEKTNERRESMMTGLDADVQSTYEKVREAREGDPLAVLEGSSCSGCGMSLTPNTRSRVLGAASVVHCDSCQRILYAPQALQDLS